jgi:hypothetical protein
MFTDDGLSDILEGIEPHENVRGTAIKERDRVTNYFSGLDGHSAM